MVWCLVKHRDNFMFTFYVTNFMKLEVFTVIHVHCGVFWVSSSVYVVEITGVSEEFKYFFRAELRVFRRRRTLSF